MSDVRELLHAAAASPAAPVDMDAVLARARRRRWRRLGVWTVVVGVVGGLVPAGLSLAPADRRPDRVEVVKPAPRPAPDDSVPDPILPSGAAPGVVERATGVVRQAAPPTTGHTGERPPVTPARSVVFVRGGQLWLMGQDGSDPAFVHYGSGLASGPAWSRDGTRVAFSERGEVHVLTMAGDGAGTVRSLGPGTNPSWAPDGRSLAFAATDSAGNTDVWVMAADGTGRRRLTLSPDYESSPAWSPNGDAVAYVNLGASFDSDAANVGGVGQQAIHVVAPDGSNERVIVSEAREPAWSSDGEHLAYVRPDGIWVSTRTGYGPVRVTDAGSGLDYAPAWSSDDTVLFARDPNARPGDSIYSSLWSVRVDGSGLRRLTDDALANDDDPAVRL